MAKADFLYFELKASNGISLIMFRGSGVKFSEKNQKKIRCILSNNAFNASK